jgi:hypothetical protein
MASSRSGLWSKHPDGPKLKAQFFAKVDVWEVIMVDL